MTLDMANIVPSQTGVGAYIHVFQDVDRRSKHGPRIKVFPGNPAEGNATTVCVPTSAGHKACVKGTITVDAKTLQRALRFVEINWKLLSDYWKDSTMGTSALLSRLVPV
jgi:hypothetical protein